MAFGARIFAFRALTGQAFLLDALELLGVFEELAREAGFIVSEDVEGVGLLDPGASLGDHDFDAVVVIRVGGVLN